MTSPARILLQNRFLSDLNKNEKFAALDGEKQNAIARRLERACFNLSIDIANLNNVPAVFDNGRFVQIYSAECMRILWNISPSVAYNSYFVDSILSGVIDVTKVGSLKNEDLNPEVSKKERDEIAARQNQKTEIKVSRKYKCKKCGGNETIPIEYQGRAADEASSKSVRCIACGHVWRY